MTLWTVEVPPRLYEEIAHLSPGSRRALHDTLDSLAADPRDPASTTEPITGAELRRIDTPPVQDTGDRITLLYRVHTPTADRLGGRVEVIFILSGP
ncbi:type II toxin-antitoxin system RelE/ParE family toxin [Streptomyces sp. NPDC096136]|uniref:type II toxin-antitoxin system RelE family toxin n=1 Tax=Streptomyces sp. NPDC096136 TaxID=3366076 RepID=UPI0038063F27